MKRLTADLTAESQSLDSLPKKIILRNSTRSWMDDGPKDYYVICTLLENVAEHSRKPGRHMVFKYAYVEKEIRDFHAESEAKLQAAIEGLKYFDNFSKCLFEFVPDQDALGQTTAYDAWDIFSGKFGFDE